MRFISSKVVLAVLVLGSAWGPAPGGAQVDNVWPISGTSQPDASISSPYGPRQKASENFRYDFHQGIDIQTPVGTPVHAIADGEVRIAGTHSSYTNPLVQLKHQNGAFYGNYMHLSSWSVSVGQQIKKGEVIGTSGTGDSDFAHLHLEVRAGSLWRKSCVNPCRYLPYTDTAGLTVHLTHVELADPAFPLVIALVESPREELDLDRIEVATYNAQDGQLLSQQAWDLEEINFKYNGDPKVLDNPDLEGVVATPARFNAASPVYQIEFRFHNLSGAPQLKVEVKVLDIWGNTATASFAN